MIPHSCPHIDADDISALAACAQSRRLATGEGVAALEARIARDLGYAGAVSTVNGGQAIHLALRAHFPEGGAAVALPSYVCRSVYDAVCLARCRPVLWDIDPATFSLAPSTTGRKDVDAVIVPHLFGIRADIEGWTGRSKLVIEDCAQRLSPPAVSRTESKGHVRILSFAATKLLTGGQGGMLLSDDPRMLARAVDLRDGSSEMPSPSLWLPYTDLQAALVMSQWRRLDAFLARRAEIAGRYMRALESAFPQHIVQAMRARDTYHFRFVVSVADVQAAISHAAGRGVAFRLPVAPAGLHSLFHLPGDFTETENAVAHLLSVPIYPSLTDEEVETVAAVMLEVLAI